MCNKEKESTQNRISLSCFAAYSSNGGVIILNVGQIEFRYFTGQNTKTNGYIEINGDNLEISTYNKKPDLPNKAINEDTCLLLLAEDSSLTSYYRAVLVSSIPEITTVAFDLL